MTSIVMSDAMSGSSELSDALPDGELRTKDDAAEFSRARPRAIGGVFMMLVGGILAVMGFVAWTKLFCLAWRVIQGDYTTTTPRAALVLLFVPLFNVYWMFVAMIRLAVGLNRVATVRGIQAGHVPGFLGVMACGLGLVTLLFGGWDVSPVAYLTTSTAATLSFAIFFYCVQRTAGQIAMAGEQQVAAANA